MIEKGHVIAIPPHGYVRYVDHLGDDTRIVEAARVSYGSRSKGEEADKKLLEYLFKNRHTSPFEQCNITFNIKMPVFCMRQFVRHRTFRLNEFSGRYSEMPDEFFEPTQWRRQDDKNKQGSIAPIHPENRHNNSWQACNTEILRSAYAVAYVNYETLLQRGVAKELARIVLPVGIYTEIYVNIDLHNLIHFLNLRTDSHAQKEIQDIAWLMCDMAEQLFPWTMALFNKYTPIQALRNPAPVSEKKGDKDLPNCRCGHLAMNHNRTGECRICPSPNQCKSYVPSKYFPSK